MSLQDTLYRVRRDSGIHPILRRGEGGSSELTTWRMCLEAGESARYESVGEESVLVLLEGAAVLRAAGKSWTVQRSGVFTGRATALYLPPGAALEARAEAALEAVIVSAPATAGGEPVLRAPSEVVVHSRGRGGYQREVHDLFVDDPWVSRLMVGETFNPPGGWSSFPPHKHDGRDGEPKLEEVYYYRIDPPQGFAQQLLYTAGGESAAHTVKDGDAVLLPYGYHPVAAPPGYQAYYLWALAGEVRRLTVFEDPAHRWLHDAP